MPVTLVASGTTGQTAGGAESIINAPNVAGVFQVQLDLNLLAAGDVIELRVYKMVKASGTSRVAFFTTYSGAQATDAQIVLSLPIANTLTDSNAVQFGIKQTFGTTRALPYAVLNLEDFSAGGADTSMISDIYSLLSDHHSDFQSRVPKAVATNSQLSDLASDLRSFVNVMSGIQSDAYSLLSDHHSDFQSRVPKLVATDSALSDARSDIKSAIAGITVTIGASDVSDIASAVVAGLPIGSQVSDIYSLLSDLQSDFQSRVPKRVATDSQLSDVSSDLRSVMGAISVNLTASDISDIGSTVVAAMKNNITEVP